MIFFFFFFLLLLLLLLLIVFILIIITATTIPHLECEPFLIRCPRRTTRTENLGMRDAAVQSGAAWHGAAWRGAAWRGSPRDSGWTMKSTTTTTAHTHTRTVAAAHKTPEGENMHSYVLQCYDVLKRAWLVVAAPSLPTLYLSVASLLPPPLLESLRHKGVIGPRQ